MNIQSPVVFVVGNEPSTNDKSIITDMCYDDNMNPNPNANVLLELLFALFMFCVSGWLWWGWPLRAWAGAFGMIYIILYFAMRVAPARD